ncbi:hypothetical protein I3760_04G124000 [Carya illinoinensis]|uniref:CAAX prenyl protease 2/Lysostaphin resistance protein A-like domain-containing protein n=2 Tax=Carya illinoinensis TaxID=32201 RepID=A0A922FDQ0_CARIL|nr:hypothetical protein I3760_04G124000 [Carya illinoinensis]KAG6717900.1 hypothetical protein I3842_04G123400 [Carya illinoinensis]
MILLQCASVYLTPPKFSTESRKLPDSFLSPNSLLRSSVFKSNRSSKASFKRSCAQNEDAHGASIQGFSVLAGDIPWDRGSIWSTMAFYMFCLHIPLSFGGLSVVAAILHEPLLDPETEAISLLIAQILELIATLLLLQWTAKPRYNFLNLLRANTLSRERNWLLASVLGFGFLFLLVFLTSILADRLIGPKAVNNPIVKEILLSSDISRATCVLVYCIVTPLLEETVYRGFLLTSISSTMKWQKAIFVSSVIFSAAHFSGENFLQLSIIGCVLGCSYCWTGNLSSSIVIHSLYNALTLMLTLLS